MVLSVFFLSRSIDTFLFLVTHLPPHPFFPSGQSRLDRFTQPPLSMLPLTHSQSRSFISTSPLSSSSLFPLHFLLQFHIHSSLSLSQSTQQSVESFLPSLAPSSWWPALSAPDLVKLSGNGSTFEHILPFLPASENAMYATWVLIHMLSFSSSHPHHLTTSDLGNTCFTARAHCPYAYNPKIISQSKMKANLIFAASRTWPELHIFCCLPSLNC